MSIRLEKQKVAPTATKVKTRKFRRSNRRRLVLLPQDFTKNDDMIFWKNIKKYSFCLLTAAFCVVGKPVFGQFNILTGYVYGQTEVPIFDQIVQNYNDRHPDNLQPLQKMRPMQGINIGVRHRWDNVGLEFNWTTKFNQMNDQFLIGTTSYKTILYYKNQAFCLGSELFFGWFGVGASLDFNEIEFKKVKTNENAKITLLNENIWSNHFFVNFELKLNRVMALSIKPYVQSPFRSVNLFPIEQSLNPDVAATADPSKYEQRIVTFGVMLLFTNGPK